jgi:Asp-tRNA(Asn)/Glu-tRNA(Gln) amidotransferase C subunit
MTVTKETLQRMIEEMDLLPLSDEELERAVSAVNQLRDAMRALEEWDLSDVPGSYIFRAEPER